MCARFSKFSHAHLTSKSSHPPRVATSSSSWLSVASHLSKCWHSPATKKCQKAKVHPIFSCQIKSTARKYSVKWVRKKTPALKCRIITRKKCANCSKAWKFGTILICWKITHSSTGRKGVKDSWVIIIFGRIFSANMKRFWVTLVRKRDNKNPQNDDGLTIQQQVRRIFAWPWSEITFNDNFGWKYFEFEFTVFENYSTVSFQECNNQKNRTQKYFASLVKMRPVR